MLTEWRLVKEDGTPIPATTQVGIVQGFGLLAWESCSISINGEPFLSQYDLIDHPEYLQLLLGYTEIERRSLLHSIGWNDDEMTKFDTTKVEMDPTCACDCKFKFN